VTGALRTVCIPRLLHVGEDSLAAVADLVVSHGFPTARTLVCSGDGPSLAFAATVIESLRRAGLDVEQQTGLTGRLPQAAEVAGRIIATGVTLVVAVGGGKVIDTVKVAAARTGTDFVTVPTTLAHDGISSPVASLDTNGRKVSHAAAMPTGIVVDTRIIGSAPPRTLRAGVGDLVSNLTAILDWQLAAAGGHDRFDAFSAMIAESAARPALDLTDLAAADGQAVLAKGLILSGLAMAAAGTSRPCSGAEHLISHSLDALLGERAALHGEQVALGCLISARAHGSPLLAQLTELFGKLGLPVRPEDAGLTEEDLCRAVAAAPGTRPDRYTVLDRLDLGESAIRDLVAESFV
jgi:glycerol-1-phosphate dehydrogenase [NAD(P)+]